MQDFFHHPYSKGIFQGPPTMGPPLWEASHTIPISLGILMGIVWVLLTIKGVPLLGVPENPINIWYIWKTSGSSDWGTGVQWDEPWSSPQKSSSPTRRWLGTAIGQGGIWMPGSLSWSDCMFLCWSLWTSRSYVTSILNDVLCVFLYIHRFWC